jgi:hypothetical protein
MIRLVIAAGFLFAATASAFAVCPRDGSVTRGIAAKTVASQPADDHGALPAAADTRKPG